MKLESTHTYVEGILKGDRTLLSRAITLVESTRPEHQERASEIIDAILPHTGNSLRIGITGVPGVGKSTFIEAIGEHVISQGNKLAVLAVDPSSEKSKGSILGDKTRMETLSHHPDAFIRPSPSCGSLGGVTRRTRESILLCEAAGFNVIFIETVGVGQSETIVSSMVDFFLLLMLAGAGDELQGIKRGIMEMADALVITKADGNNVQKAKLAKAEYQTALHLFPKAQSDWTTQVLTCSSLEKTGLDQVWQTIQDYQTKTKDNGYFETKRSDQNKKWLHESIKDILLDHFFKDSKIQKELSKKEKDVLSGKINPFKAAQELTQKILK